MELCKTCSVSLNRWKPPKALPPPPPPVITLADSEEFKQEEPPTLATAAACFTTAPVSNATSTLTAVAQLQPVPVISAPTPQFVDLCSSDDE